MNIRALVQLMLTFILKQLSMTVVTWSRRLRLHMVENVPDRLRPVSIGNFLSLDQSSSNVYRVSNGIFYDQFFDCGPLHNDLLTTLSYYTGTSLLEPACTWGRSGNGHYNFSKLRALLECSDSFICFVERRICLMNDWNKLMI